MVTWFYFVVFVLAFVFSIVKPFSSNVPAVLVTTETTTPSTPTPFAIC